MTWVKLDDAMMNHPKIEAVGVVGVGLHVAALCYANHHLTDGFISSARLPLLVNMEDIDRRWQDAEAGNEHPSIHWADILVMAGIWETVEGGYQIHDYLHYQPSRREVLKDRKKRTTVKAAAGREGGKQKASRAASKRVADVQQDGKQKCSPVARSPYPESLTSTSSAEADLYFRHFGHEATLQQEGEIRNYIALHGRPCVEWVMTQVGGAAIEKRTWHIARLKFQDCKQLGHGPRERPRATPTRAGQGHPAAARGGAVRRASDFD